VATTEGGVIVIFEEKERTRTEPKRSGEGEFAFYDAIAGAAYDVYRAKLNEWIADGGDVLCLDYGTDLSGTKFSHRCTATPSLQPYQSRPLRRWLQVEPYLMHSVQMPFRISVKCLG
jgi:hypothetical protein